MLLPCGVKQAEQRNNLVRMPFAFSYHGLGRLHGGLCEELDVTMPAPRDWPYRVRVAMEQDSKHVLVAISSDVNYH